MYLLVRWLLNTIALFIVIYFVPHFHYRDIVSLAIAALVLGLLNAIVRPILFLLTLPVTILTLGLFVFVLNAIMLPHVMQFNADAVPDAMSAIADAMEAGARTRDFAAAPRGVAALVAPLPVPQSLRDAGVPEAILDEVAAEAAGSATVQNNPKPVTGADVRELLRAAW